MERGGGREQEEKRRNKGGQETMGTTEKLTKETPHPRKNKDIEDRYSSLK